MENLPPITAGIILIGNELLSGQTQDKNMNYIAKKLADLHIDLLETIVIPDREEDIIRVVRDHHHRFTYVFTTGGIGPTHDDITAEAISKAFNRPYVLHPEARKILADKYGQEELNDSRRRMAMMPEGASLIFNDVSNAPGFKIENVFVMAGIPSIMQSMMDYVVPTLQRGPERYKTVMFYDIKEGQIAPGLRQIQQQYPNILIGSYPHWPKGTHEGLKISIQGHDQQEVQKAADEIIRLCREFNAEPTILNPFSLEKIE